MKCSILSFLFLFFFSNHLFSNDTLGFVSPVDHQIRLTGNFMEIRTNHFHSGIDIKSKRGVEGDVIRSAQKGFVSRIRITSGSYGNALYIDHPNGYTTVYAHLKSFIPRIEKYLKDIQYEVQQFEVDIYLPDSLIMVNRSEEIGKMGNTGRSFGPHLHFEIRDTKTEIPKNPEELGIGPNDTKAPTLQSLVIYDLGSDNEILKTNSKYFKSKTNPYTLHTPTIKVDNSRIGLGLQMFDTMNGSSNKNGVYAYKVYVDGKLFVKWNAEEFSFYDSRKINGFIDFQKQKTLGQKIYLLFKQHCSSIPELEAINEGVIELEKGDRKRIKIVAQDLYKNKSELSFELEYEDKLKSLSENEFRCDEELLKTSGIFEVQFLAETFFSPVDLKIRSSKKKVLNQNCHTLSLGNRATAVSKYYKISCSIPKNYDQNWTFISTDSRGRFINFGADTLDGKMYTWTDQLGEFHVYSDKTAPKTQIINLESSMKSPWKIRIKDNLIPDGHLDDLQYSATVNDQWILMTYDLKNDVLIFDDFKSLPPMPLSFQLTVIDDSGNKTVLNRQIK